MIALATRDDAEFFGCAGFEMELARKFDGGFGGFGTAGSEVDAAACEIWRSEGKKAGGESFRGGGVELSGVSKGDLGGLRGHGVGDGLDAVADADDSGLARGIEIFLTVGGDDPGAFAANGDGKRFLEIARKESGRVCIHDERNCSRGACIKGQARENANLKIRHYTEPDFESVVGWRRKFLGLISQE